MARNSNNDDLLMDDELTAAFLSDDEPMVDEQPQQQAAAPVDEQMSQDDEWDEEEAVAGQLAVDVFETREKLVVKARTAGVNRNDLDVSIADNILSIRGTLSAGSEQRVDNYFVQ